MSVPAVMVTFPIPSTLNEPAAVVVMLPPSAVRVMPVSTEAAPSGPLTVRLPANEVMLIGPVAVSALRTLSVPAFVKSMPAPPERLMVSVSTEFKGFVKFNGPG